MKVSAIVLLCIVAAAQARSAVDLHSSRALAGLGENPWVVHLRIAVATSGFLNTCAGSLINGRWVLTAGDCLHEARFIWVRYGVVRVIYPELVTENSVIHIQAEHNAGLININRDVQYNANIAPVALAASTEEVDSTTFCAFGENNGAPGEDLYCFTVDLQVSGDNYVAKSDDGLASRFDAGAPLVADGKQIGILTSAGSGDNAGTFVSTAAVLGWIAEITHLTLS